MGGPGTLVSREYTDNEREAIASMASTLGIPAADAFSRLGDRTFDVYLNGVAFCRNVPAAAWAFRIGGYQVIKKWFSYRERDILGRALTREEARYIGEMARRLTAVLLLGPSLDANYQTVKASAFAWPSPSPSGAST